MEEIEEEIICTPPEIQRKSLQTSYEILPQKSADIYNRQYDIFIEWCKKHEVGKYSENVLLTYFFDLSKKYSPSSMWWYYSMLKATLSVKNDVDLNKYKKLTAFLKQKGRTHVPKKSKTLSQEEILKFLLDAPDEIYLMMKICVIFGIAVALRNEELLNLKITDIEHKETVLIVHIIKTKTNWPRLFVITAEFEGQVKSIELFNKYLALQPQETSHDRFFLTYRNGKYSIQPVGIHTFGGVPSKIANYLHLPEPYRFIRLPFGVSASPEVFHNGMVSRFSDIEGVEIMIDDFLIYGSTKEEHDSRLKKVLDRAPEIGIKFSKIKSKISQIEVKYLGHIPGGPF